MVSLYLVQELELSIIKKKDNIDKISMYEFQLN